MTHPAKPKVIPPPKSLRPLGPLVVVDGDCAYFPSTDEEPRTSRTAFALPGPLSPAEYEKAMCLGMRRSGTLVYRPLCGGCRRCQPFRVDVEQFYLSRSQRRVQKRCEGRFTVELLRPQLDEEHLALYARYQEDQHDKDGQAVDSESYARFLIETVADTWELAWRDDSGALVAVGIIDVVDDGISTVYFYWDPKLRDFSIGTFSALYEIDLCRRWGKRYYYLGYLVRGSRTMAYKAQFTGGEVWDGKDWVPVVGRDLDDPALQEQLIAAEKKSIERDAECFLGGADD